MASAICGKPALCFEPAKRAARRDQFAWQHGMCKTSDVSVRGWLSSLETSFARRSLFHILCTSDCSRCSAALILRSLA